MTPLGKSCLFNQRSVIHEASLFKLITPTNHSCKIKKLVQFGNSKWNSLHVSKLYISLKVKKIWRQRLKILSSHLVVYEEQFLISTQTLWGPARWRTTPPTPPRTLLNICSAGIVSSTGNPEKLVVLGHSCHSSISRKYLRQRVRSETRGKELFH